MQQGRTFLWQIMLLILIAASASSGAFAALPTNSSPIALTSDDKYVWVVNPNVDLIEPVQNDTVTVHEVGNDKNQKVTEIPLILTFSPLGRRDL